MKTTKVIVPIGGDYESPECDIIEINAEGVLCGSLQQLEEYEGEYEW